MGLFQCYICGGGNLPGVCEKCAHIAKKWQEMQDRLHKTENELHSLRDNVCGLLEKYAAQILDRNEDQGNIWISSKDIGKMWEQIGIRYCGKEITEIKEFARHACLEAGIIAAAFNLFRHKSDHCDDKTPLDKLSRLHEYVTAYSKFMEWRSELDMKPEYLIDRIVKGKRG